jgi:hypothetical protein
MSANDPGLNCLVNKEARDIHDEILGHVQEVNQNYVLTQKLIQNNNEKFYIPSYLIQKFNGNVLWFRVSKEQARTTFMINSSP